MDTTMVLSTAGGNRQCFRLSYRKPKYYATRTFPNAFQQHSEQIRRDDYESVDKLRNDSRPENLSRNASISNDESKNVELQVVAYVAEPEESAINQSTQPDQFHRQIAGGLNVDSSPKMPPRGGRVYCTRSFPPNCGPCVSNLAMEDNVETDQERTRTDTSVIASEIAKGIKVETECQDDAHKAVGKGEEAANTVKQDSNSFKFEDDNMINGVSKRRPTKKRRENTSKICPTRPIIKNRFPCDNKSSSNQFVVLALTTTEQCPWRQPRRRNKKKGSLVASPVGDKKAKFVQLT